jgi:hypothetical protein
MTTIYNSTFKIIKNDDNNYNIEYEDIIFYESLKKTNFFNLDIIEDNIELKKIKIKTDKIENLNDFLEKNSNRITYNNALNLISNIGNQLIYLKNNGLIIPYLDIDNIIVINNTDFFIMNFEKILTIDIDNNIQIIEPYKKNMFFSPELFNIDILPSKIHSNSWLFSLASLTIFCLNNYNTTYDITNKDKYYKLIENIESTKLYYSLLRCLENEPKNRKLLII